MFDEPRTCFEKWMRFDTVLQCDQHVTTTAEELRVDFVWLLQHTLRSEEVLQVLNAL